MTKNYSEIKQLLPPSAYSTSRWGFILVAIALTACIILSILSWLELCVEHCSANQDYRLLGFPFATIGMTFFPLLLFLHFLSLRISLLSPFVALLIASAAGSEIMFILVQKYHIGHWCPVCLSIAACVFFAAFVLLIQYCIHLKTTFNIHDRGKIMKIIKQSLLGLSCTLLGFLTAFVGISKHDEAAAAINEVKNHIAFGTKDSPVTVYFVTDWFCPSCKKIEPMIEKLYPKIKSDVTFYFIDYPIHKKSSNFSPYNLAFLINDKPNYFKARDMLIELTEITEDPTDEEIEKRAKKLGLNFHELSYLQVKAGMDYFDKVVNEYNLNSTPTIIITNPARKTVMKLEGRDEISEEKILNAIKQMTPTK